MNRVTHIAGKLFRQVHPAAIDLAAKPHRAGPGAAGGRWGRRATRSERKAAAGNGPDAIDDGLTSRVQDCVRAGPNAVQARLAELDREWDAGRWLQVPALALAWGGVIACAATGQRRWLAAPMVTIPMALLPAFGRVAMPNALESWTQRLLSRAGVRTRTAIQRERIALHVLRGDYDLADAPHDPKARIQHVLRHAA